MTTSKLLLTMFLLASANNAKGINDICEPFKGLFIFDKYEFGKSFDQLRRFMVSFIQGLPDETHIYVITVGNNDIGKFEFKKVAGNESWISNIGHFSTSGDVIDITTISRAIYDFFDKNERPKMAEIVYLLVNQKTVIHEIEKAKTALEKKKRQIVLYGNHTKGDVWAKLSMGEKHIEVLGDEEEIAKSIDNVRKQSCIDSTYVCDTDDYWDLKKNSCYRCSYICSKAKSTSPEKCDCDCPYYFSSRKNQVMQNNSNPGDCSDRQKADETDGSTNVGLIVAVVVLVLIIIIILLCLAVIFRKKASARLTSCMKRKVPESAESLDKGTEGPSPDCAETRDKTSSTGEPKSSGMGTEGSSPDCAETRDKTPSTVKPEEENLKGVDFRDLDPEKYPMVDVREPETAEQPYIAQPSEP